MPGFGAKLACSSVKQLVLLSKNFFTFASEIASAWSGIFLSPLSGLRAPTTDLFLVADLAVDLAAERFDHGFEAEAQHDFLEEPIHDHLLGLELGQAARHQVKQNR